MKQPFEFPQWIGTPSRRYCKANEKESSPGGPKRGVGLVGLLRRVKCDETPEACQNCSSTGRKCDGYDAQRLPRTRLPIGTRSPIMSTVLSPPIATGFRWKITSDERRCYAFFRHRSVPTITGFFNSALWETLVVQISQAEQSVYHAVVAFSAIHADYEARGMPLAREDLDNSWHRFAIDQCGRSYACLSARSASHDPYLREVTLVCCILFVLSELMRGHYDLAFAHLRNGLGILKETVCSSGQLPALACAVNQCLVDAFVHLNAQSTFFGVEDSPFPMQVALPPSGTDESKLVFQSLSEAQQVYYPLLKDMSWAVNKKSARSPAEARINNGSLSQWHFDIRRRLGQFEQAYEHFYNRPDQRSIKEQRGADIIYMHQLSLSGMLERQLPDLNPTGVPEDHTPVYEKLLSLAEAVISSFTDHPSVLLDTGIIPPLFLVSTKCRQHDVRWRAIRALQAWPHREGPWDSNLIAKVAIEAVTLEEKALGTNQNGEQSGPVRHAFTTVVEDQYQAHMVYNVDDEGTVQTRTFVLE
ncbi:hypothetical protein BBP40_000647 [Aspergillus hancockii]|nr:hypothetical protein BBP40_000647 [Aspergillus hancockii]